VLEAVVTNKKLGLIIEDIKMARSAKSHPDAIVQHIKSVIKGCKMSNKYLYTNESRH
jgi:hypothetical protein